MFQGAGPSDRTVAEDYTPMAEEKDEPMEAPEKKEENEDDSEEEEGEDKPLGAFLSCSFESYLNRDARMRDAFVRDAHVNSDASLTMPSSWPTPTPSQIFC